MSEVPMDIDVAESYDRECKSRNRVTVLPAIPESPSKKRKNVSPQKMYNVTSTSPLVERRIARAVRRIPKLPGPSDSKTVKKDGTGPIPPPKSIYILDTNILVSHLPEIRTVIEKLTRQSRLNEVSLLITKVVLDELDYLKRDNSSVNRICKFVRERLKCGHLIGEDYLLESARAANPPSRGNASASNNDDRILQSAQVISDSFKSSNTVLVTNDINLHNKCLLSRFPSLDWKEFRCRMNSEDITLSPISPVDLTSRQQPDNKKKRSLSPVDVSAVRPLVSSVSPSSSRASVPSPSVQKSPTPASYSSWVERKDKFTDQIRPFVIHHLKDLYGDKLWTKVFNIDWTTCSFEDMIQTMRRSWIGTFNEAFDRKKTVLDHLTKIGELSRDEMKNYPSLLSHLTDLHGEITPYLQKSRH